jgi:hypothetical protein
LQGPDTEPEAIQVIRNTLSKGQDCHVKLTNYKKNGELFQNLLSMKPVFDADNIYRYVIGVQFEIKDDQNLKQRLVQLDKLLRLLPSKLGVKSKASARAKGALAVKTTGEANQLLMQKDQVLQQTKQMEQMEQNSNRPKAMAAQQYEMPMSQLNLDNTVFGFTRILWLQKAPEIMQAMAMDPFGVEVFTRYCKTTCQLYQVRVRLRRPPALSRSRSHPHLFCFHAVPLRLPVQVRANRVGAGPGATTPDPLVPPQEVPQLGVLLRGDGDQLRDVGPDELGGAVF